MSGLPLVIEETHIVVGRTGAVFAKDINRDQAEDIGRQLAALDDISQWVKGDYYLMLASHGWEQLEIFTENQLSDMRECAYTCLRIKKRRPELSFAHHQAVAAHTEDEGEQQELLHLAQVEELSAAALRRHLSEKKEMEGATRGRKHFTIDGCLTSFRCWVSHQDFGKWPAAHRSLLRSKLERFREQIDEALQKL